MEGSSERGAVEEREGAVTVGGGGFRSRRIGLLGGDLDVEFDGGAVISKLTDEWERDVM